MNGGMTYVNFFPNDWGGATRGFLSLEEEGLYIRCCSYMWDRGEPIPGNDNLAAKLLHVQVQKYIKVMAALIEKGKMIRGQGVVFNTRVMEDIERYRLEQSERSDRAKKGHQTRVLSMQKTTELHEEITRLRAHIERIERRSHADHPPTDLGGVPPHQPGGGSLGGHSGGTPLGHQEKDNKINGEILNQQSTTLHIPLPLPLPVKEESKKEKKESPTHTTRMPRAPEPELVPVGVGVCRPGEQEVSPGLFVNCDTVRHAEFAISIAGIAMQLATANTGLSKNEATEVARESSVAHALQWAAEIAAGRSARAVVPSHPANFIRGAIIAQRNKDAAHRNAMSRPQQPGRGRSPPNVKPTRSEIFDAVAELESESQSSQSRRFP